MAVKSFFLPQGMIIGEVTEHCSSFDSKKIQIKVKNPALVITKQNGVMLAPFLQLVDEQEITLDMEDIAFKQLFTPKLELANHYSQLFGSGIVVANTLSM